MGSAQKYVLTFLRRIFDIRDDSEAEQVVLERIKRDADFHGANLLTLIFAIVIASIGLNLNSIAIIIGAMLISPLMGPILGIGASLGINDTAFLKQSLKNIGIATVISIAVSTLYFLASPISNVQSELLARTSPTIYDVLIAFFGGLAGIVGSTRLQKGNVIPGVAIATALMPPLCTVGYGLATMQPHFFLGALYLYGINCIFICLATLVGVTYLGWHPIQSISEEQARRTRRFIAAVVVAMIIPAVYFGYVLVQETNFSKNADRYIAAEFESPGYTIIYKNVDWHSAPPSIGLAFLGKHFSDEEIAQLEADLPRYGLSGVALTIKQDSASLTEDQWNEAIANIQSEAERVQAIEAKLSSQFAEVASAPQLLAEAVAINPRVADIAVGTLSLGSAESAGTTTPSSSADIPIAIVYSSSTTPGFTAAESKTLRSWLESRLRADALQVFFAGK